MQNAELKEFLDQKVIQYHNPIFIETDPIQIPHMFSKKEDIEIAGFLTAIISWGNRKMIIKNASNMMERFDNAPYDFIMNHSDNDLKNIEGFVHRTFNAIDLQCFIKSLQHIYKKHDGLENVLSLKSDAVNYARSISSFKQLFFEISHVLRTEKHISDPMKNSAAKRINMFLRWMVRDNSAGVDFGIWKSHDPKHLSCPLDVHSGNVARKLGILQRKQNDWKAVYELDTSLRAFDANDPVKYDFALFGLGVFEKF
ncbi:TIGR02757 family protein [Flavobacteriaceae bacterium S356]|uniref:TIGR02757 family protein n=1 Tax=Asprobacillus argus TaxID=3076534 RepID=A0ABU3LHN5_9FLAO|nr:TIGR02757 family protein [Flavobacteriaceae bacterium S356]